MRSPTLRAATASPAFLSERVVRTTRLVLSMLTVCGSTGSIVESRNVEPSMMSVSFCGPSLLKLSSRFTISSFFGSVWASIPSASASTWDSGMGVVVRCGPITLPFDRNGPLLEAGSKSMYCSPAGESPDTRTGLAAGILVFALMFAITSTPVGVGRRDWIRPTRIPRTDTSWLASNPPDSGSRIVTWKVESSGLMRNAPIAK